jgi:aspartyl/asparaginyl beta-hydroxylase (cupin superfamily)
MRLDMKKSFKIFKCETINGKIKSNYASNNKRDAEIMFMKEYKLHWSEITSRRIK